MTKKKNPAVAKGRSRAEEWDAARAWYEFEPTVSYADVGRRLGVSKQRAQQVGTEGLWRKKADMQRIVAVAQMKADAQFTPAAESGGEATHTAAPPPPPPTLQPANVPPVPASPAEPSTAAEVAAEAKAAQLRADVTTRHRMPWPAIVAKVLNAVTNKDWPAVKGLKVAAEAVAISQKAERLAWGMESGDAPGSGAGGSSTVRVILERETIPHEPR